MKFVETCFIGQHMVYFAESKVLEKQVLEKNARSAVVGYRVPMSVKSSWLTELFKFLIEWGGRFCSISYERAMIKIFHCDGAFVYFFLLA